MRFDDVSGFVLDVDGTLVRRDADGAQVLPGARELLEAIRASGRPLVLFTNGSHVPPEVIARELRDDGLPVTDRELLTPVCSALTYLAQRHPDQRTLIFATEATRMRMANAGVRLIDHARGDEAEVVFVAHPDSAELGALERAARAVTRGARLLTASYQPGYAGANGIIFSRGAMVTAAIAKASGARPTVVGKPSLAAVREIVERLGVPADRLAVIGDDLGMDIALGHLGGARTVLVRSGISGSIDLERVPARRRPEAVVDGVQSLLEWL